MNEYENIKKGKADFTSIIACCVSIDDELYVITRNGLTYSEYAKVQSIFNLKHSGMAVIKNDWTCKKRLL